MSFILLKKCVFLLCGKRQILHILIRSVENLGKKREKREPALLSSSLVKKSSESSGTWRGLQISMAKNNPSLKKMP